jgi:hypothetical protein
MELNPLEKLVFIYLCENCDCAGFYEINKRKAIFDINTNPKNFEGAMKGLARGIIFSRRGLSIYIKNFLKHQKNLPLNYNNKAHLGIIRSIENQLDNYGFDSVNDFIMNLKKEEKNKGASEGLASPLGIGIGIGIGKEDIKKGNDIQELEYPDNLNNSDFRNTFSDWLEYKHQKKQTYTKIGIKKLLTSLSKKEKEIGLEMLIEEIDNSIAKSWIGITFALSETKNRGKKLNQIKDMSFMPSPDEEL